MASHFSIQQASGHTPLASGELHGISRFRSHLIAVLSPRRRRLEGVHLHRYRTLDSRDLTTHNNIPVTTVHRTQVDLTDVLTPHQLTNVIYQAAFLRLDFPEPRVNTDLHGFEVDFHWPDLKLAVEIDGPHHGRPRDRDDDARKDAALQAAGHELLRFTDEDVYQRPGRITNALNARRPTPSSSSASRRA